MSDWHQERYFRGGCRYGKTPKYPTHAKTLLDIGIHTIEISVEDMRLIEAFGVERFERVFARYLWQAILEANGETETFEGGE